MKKTLIVGSLLAGATGLLAQGTLNFSDTTSGYQIHVYAPQLADPTVQLTGNTPTDKPAGTQTGYTGGLVGGSGTGNSVANGNDVTFEVYALGGGTSAAAASALQALSQYTSVGYTIAAGAGLFHAVSPAGDTGIPNSAATDTATVALAAWYNGGGSYTSLAAAQAAGVPAGESTPVFLTALGGVVPPAGGTPGLPPTLGVQSFSLTASPEPSTIALCVMGASAFLLRRRMSK
jgi:hypothetical protein